MADDQKIRVLLVDDHLLVRVGLSGVLERTGRCEIVGAVGTGVDAVERYGRQRPDVTLLDRWLPDICGEEVLARVLKDDPAARIVVLSVDEGEEDIHRALQAGAKGYLPKSVAASELLTAIETVHAGGGYVSEALRGRLEQRAQREELKSRELEVLTQIVGGASNKEIARSLGLSEVTVKVYVGRVLQKLEVQDRTQAATTAIARGIVHLD